MRLKSFVSGLHIRFTLSFLFIFVASISTAAEAPSASAGASEKALKYHAILVGRPEPGYLFDRFYNTWLDDSTVDSLQAFLLKQVDTSQKTSDRLLLAFFYAKKGDDVAALQAFRAALEHDPGSAATWYHKALVEARTLDFDTAIADLKKAREKSPNEKLAVQIDKQLGKIYARNRQTPEALKVWQTLLAANPNDEELNEDLVELHIDEGLFKEAASLEEKLAERTKDQYLAVTRKLRLGDIYHRAGDRTKAVAAYMAALDAVGSESWLEREILAQLDQVYRREDDLTGLKRLYGDLLKKYEKRIAIQRRYAQLLVELGEQDPAIAAYREILKLTPGDRATREEFIGVLAKLGKQDEAIKELESLSAQHAKDAELRFHLASLYQDVKKANETSAAVDRYLETSDGSEYAYLRAARLLERLDNKDAATHLYEKMAQKFADSGAAQDAYAAFLYSSGKKKEAIERWRKLAEAGDVAQKLQVARTLSTRNENEAALELLKGGLEKVKNDPLYLGQIATAALALKKYDEAIPWAEDRVRLADQPADLEAAVDQAATVIERADKLEVEARRLEGVERRSVPETCLLAELLERAGNSDRADAALKLAADKGSVLAISEQIRLFSERREWSAAADATRKILETPGGRKSLHIRRLVELYQRDFRFEEGLKWIDEWKRLSPGSTTPWVTEVRMLQGLGRNDEALKVLRTAVLKFDQDDDLRVRLGEFYVETEKPADAMRIYWQLYEETEDLNGKLRWAQKLAELAQQQGTVQQLVQDFDERAHTNRQSIVPLLALSEIYRVTDDYEGRRRALTAAAKIKPDDIYLLQQIARVEEQDGDWRAAIATLERAAPLDKTNRTREQIAQLHLNNGNEETGFAMLFELAGAAKSDPRTLETIADTLCGLHEWERAADFLQRRITNHPADYRLRYLLAVALEEAGRTAEATQQFIQLLSNQEELQTKKTSAPAAAQSQQMNSYYDFIRKLMPAEAFQWFQLIQYRYTAYAYRQQQGYGAVLRSSAGGASRGQVQLPTSVDNIRPLAITHLLSMSATLDDDRLNDICKELESRGIKQAKILTKLDPTRPDFASILPEMLEKEPDNETALAIMVVQQMGVRNDALGPYCSKAFEKFRKSRPELAFMAAMQAGLTDAKNAESASDAKGAMANKYLDEALKIAATFEHPNPMIVMSLTMALGGRNFGVQEVDIGDAYRQKFSQLLVKWYPEMSKSPQWGSWAFYSASQSLAKNSDPADYVRFLDDEVSRWQQGVKSPNARNQMMMMSSRQPQLIPKVSYPPPQLSDFPPQVLASFATNQDNSGFYSGQPQATIDEDAAKKIGPLLDKIKSPILGILFAHKAELNDRVDAELKKLLAAKTPQLDAYLLAASLAGEKDQHAEVVRLLQKSQYLPMKQELRRQVDALTVAAVLAAKEKSTKLDPELLDAGQKASLRLRRSRLDAPQRTELIAAMEELGLKKEAEKLDALAAATGTHGSSSAPVAVYSSSSQQTSSDQIAKLVEQGKRDMAARQLAGEVSAQVRQMLSNMQNMSYYNQMFRQVRQRVDAHGLCDDVLKAMDPGDSKNVQKIIEYAMACKSFGRPRTARTAFEHALEIRPKEDMARMQLILLIEPDDPQAAAKHLSQITKAGRPGFGQLLMGELQDYQTPFEQRIAIARLAIAYLKTLESGDVGQSYWVDGVMNSIGRQMSGRRGSLPSLYVVKSTERSGYQNQAELMAQRQKVHEELCQQMLKMPDLARTGFRYLLAATEAQGKPLDDFAADAERILMAEADAKPNRSNVMTTRVYYNSSEAEVRFRDPEEFLARRAWKSNDWKLIDEKLLPKLAGGKTRESRERLTQLASLYRCEEAKFLGEAERIVKQFKPIQPGQANEGLAVAVDVWADRGLKVDLQPLVLKQLKIDANSQNSYQAPGYLVRYIVGLAKQAPRGRQLAFLDEVATVYVGPAEKRNEFVKKNYNRNQITWGTPNGRIYVYGQLMEQLCQRSELMFTVLEHLEQYDEPKPVNNYEYRVQEAIRQLQSKGPEAAMEMLKDSPWLQDIAHFRPLVVGNRNSVSPLAALLRVNVKDADFHTKLHERVETQQFADGKTFGGGLVLAVLDQDKTPTAVLDYAGGQLDAVRKLSDKQQQDLALLLRGLVPRDANSRKDLSPAAKAAQEWMNGSQAGQAQTLLAKLEKAKRLEDVGISDGQADNYLRQNLAEMVRTDPSAAAKVFMRLCELSRDAQRRSQSHMYFSDGESLEGSLLNQAGYSIQPIDWPFFIFVIDVINNSGKKPIEATNVTLYVGRGAIQTCLNRVPKPADGKPAPAEDRIRALYEELGKALSGRPSSLIVSPFYEQLQGDLKNSSSAEKVREWTAKEMSGGKYPELAANLNAVVSLIAAEGKADRISKGDSKSRREMADYHKRFCALMLDEKLPITWRIHIAAFLAEREPIRLPLEAAKDTVTLYTQALDKGVPIDNSQNRALTNMVLSLVNDHDAEPILKQWRETWSRRYLGQQARQQNVQNQSEHLNKLSDSEALCNALQVYLAIEGPQMPESATRLLSVYDDRIGNLPQVLAILVRSHQPDEAARLLRRSALKLDVNWPKKEVTRYSDDIEKLLLAMLAKLDRDDERYLAKVLFAAMPDREQPKNAKKKTTGAPGPRDERLSKLAGEFASVSFKDPALKKLCLVLLSSGDVAGKQIAGEIAAAYDASNILSALSSPDRTRLTQEARLAQCHFRNLLRDGKYEPYVDLLKRMSAMQSDEDYRFGEAVSPFVECAVASLRDTNRKNWSPETCAAIAEALGNTLKDREYVSINNFEDFNTTLVTLYCQADKRDKLDELKKKLSEYNRSRLNNSGIKDDIWRFGLSLNGTATPENLDARIRYVQNVLRCACEQKWLERNGLPYRMRGQSDRNFLTTVTKIGLLSTDELKTHGIKAFEGIGPKNEPSYAKAAFANWLQAGKDYEKASEVWQSMVTIRPDAKKVARNDANYVLGLAVCLKNLQRYDEALNALAKLEGKEFDQALKASYDQYKREIEAAKRDASKNGKNDKPTNDKSSRYLPDGPRRILAQSCYFAAGGCGIIVSTRVPVARRNTTPEIRTCRSITDRSSISSRSFASGSIVIGFGPPWYGRLWPAVVCCCF
jgi:tetratricopeptide (TPR) repeat protein